jgi:DNA-binding transcriptional MerR regulator
MKNSTQITFAFQDTPNPGENPGVGVRIKSLKKGANEKGPAEGTAEDHTEAKKQQDKPADPKLFDETTPVHATEGQIEAKAGDQTLAQTEGGILTHTTGQTQAKTEEQSKAQMNSDSEALPPVSVENNIVNQELSNQAEYDSALTNDHEEIEEDADLPIFRGSSLSAGFSVLAGNEIKDPGVDNNEIESREGDEQDNTNGSSEKASKSTRGRKSLKTIDEGAELINIPPDEVLFQKQYYAIGEVAEMFHVNQSLLRFWETEFDIIQPRKNRKGDRHFRPVDIKNLLLIHDLLRRRKLTIEGAKDFLKKNKRSPERFAMIQSLQKIKGFILEIKATL